MNVFFRTREATNEHKPNLCSFSLEEAVEKVCQVALVIITVISAPFYFLAGFVIGWGHRIIRDLKKEKPEFQHLHGSHEGILESLAGVNFPPFLRIIIEAGTIACHIDHHPKFFAPLVGYAAGYWAGGKTQKFYNLSVSFFHKKTGVLLPSFSFSTTATQA